MTKELQILEEKFKDIKARLGAATSIIEEAERAFAHIGKTSTKLDEERSSFVEFVKNETSSDGENSIVDAADGELIHKICMAAAFNSAESRADSIYKYLQNIGGCATLLHIWEGFFSEYARDFNLLEAALLKDSRLGVRRDGNDTIVFINEARFANPNKKKLGENEIFGYLVGKIGGATIRQIQSRFKGYSNNSSMAIFNTVIGCGGTFIVEDSVHLSKVKVSVC